jgi:type II secretory pathway pseudopilin PulG
LENLAIREYLSISQLLNSSISQLLTMSLRSQTRRNPSRENERGYVLLTLLLIIALMMIATAAILPSITFNIRRDREEEMIHRGVQYSRAIRAYYKKLGRYPTKLEDLESTNNMRFLRKRYKDPITGQDFKLLHFGEVKMTFGAGIGGGGINGATPLNGQSPFGAQPQTGTNPAGSGFLNSGGGLAGSQNSYGQNQNPAGGSPNPPAGTDENSGDAAQPSPQSPNGAPQNPGEHPGVTGQDQLGQTTFGGGPIVGVVSASKKDTIREFNHKKKYNEWQFIYDPATDRGGLLTTPNQPPLQGFGQTTAPNLNGQGTNGQNSGGNNNNGFGQPMQGIQSNPNPPTTVGPGTGDQNSPPPQ